MRNFTFITVLCLAAAAVANELSNEPSPENNASPLTQERLVKDWLFQDYGFDTNAVFAEPAKPTAVLVQNATRDDSVGISPEKNYTHLLDFGSGGVRDGAKINGVQFQKTAEAAGKSRIGGKETSYGWINAPANPFGNFADDPAVKAGSGLADLLRDCNYGQNTAMQLTGLVPGKTYEVRLYCRKFNNADRTFPITFDTGEVKENITFDYNKRAPHAVTFRYVPKGTTLAIHFGKAKENYDLHALTNEELPAGAGLFLEETKKSGETETAVLHKVLTELKAGGVDVEKYEGQIAELKDRPGSDPQRKNLYIKLCKERRKLRLAHLAETAPKIVYTKHCVLSGPCQMHPTDMVSDHPYKEQIADFRPGAQLCLMTCLKDGSVRNEVLLETKEGLIRDPNLSFDGTKILFSMRNNFKNDDYHIYVMDLSNGNAVTKITSGEACSDVEPAFLPDGKIVFQSTRCVQVTDCWPVPVSNLYVCNADGSNVRRVGYDQVHTLYPQVLDNGTVIYTRWEYNDRNPVHQQPLFQMNPDGTAQTVFYGGGEFYPTAIIHARGVPDSNKVIAIASGHHVDQRGKLIMIDQLKGMDDNAGITYLAPVRKSEVPYMTETNGPVNDQFGQSGEQFQYPFALDEHNYLVAYLPEGGPRAAYPVPFGVYWMASDGKRELLAFDPKVSCGQPIALKPRPVPRIKPPQIDLAQNTGKYYIQDVYTGRGMQGVKRGTVKSMRVVGIEFRAAAIRDGRTTGNQNLKHGARNSVDRVTTPIAAGSGSWDVKHVLGEVPVEEDGSVFVEVPANTPVYFQLLDENGHCVQSMRSWTTLMPGETFSCVGCHEDKMASPSVNSSATQAMKKPVRTLNYDIGSSPVERVLSVNAPKGFDKVNGFSYTREIQPIWDKHCVSCHSGETDSAARKALPDLRGAVHGDLENDYPKYREHPWKSNGRAYTISYLQLTNYGVSGKWTRWIDAESKPMVPEPYSNGSSQSVLMKYLEPSHYNVAVSPEEKRRAACWIDLCVPFCGSYTEANLWTDEQKALYRYFEEKRKKFAE